MAATRAACPYGRTAVTKLSKFDCAIININNKSFSPSTDEKVKLNDKICSLL